ncbi:MAG: hypothetical protein ACFFEY_18355 [Candidatus Thorarchaeota archaeon]
MSEVNQILNDIKKAIEKSKPNVKLILNILYDLRSKKKVRQLTDTDFFDVVGETYNMAPEFFMKELYETFMVKIGKLIGAEKRQEMERYIIEKFCLDEDEKILYVCKANVKLTEMLEQTTKGKTKGGLFGIIISVKSGDIFITNQRLIAHGFFKVKGGESQKWFVWGPGSLWIFTGGSKRRERQKELFESTPFGYQFPIKNHMGLGKVKLLHLIGYQLIVKNRICMITIKPLNKQKREEHLNSIFNLLRKDAEEILALIQGIFEFDKGEKFKKRLIPNFIKSLKHHEVEEYNDLSDSDYLNIVKETYNIDPEFFKSVIYPKMMSWDFDPFLKVKDQVKLIVESLGS